MFARWVRALFALSGSLILALGPPCAAHAEPLDSDKAVLVLFQVPPWEPDYSPSARLVGFKVDHAHAEVDVKDGRGNALTHAERVISPGLWAKLFALADRLTPPKFPVQLSAPPDESKTMLKILQDDVEVERYDTTKGVAVAKSIEDINTQLRGLFDMKALLRTPQ